MGRAFQELPTQPKISKKYPTAVTVVPGTQWSLMKCFFGIDREYKFKGSQAGHVKFTVNDLISQA